MGVLKPRLPNYHQSVLLLIISLFTCLAAQEVGKSPSEGLVVASSIAVNTYKIQTTAPRSSGNGKYGYPFLIAPTLTPVINSRSDEDDNEAIVPSALAKPYGRKLSSGEGESTPIKKSNLKKPKTPYTYGANRRQGYVDDEDDLEEQRLYKEPKYRNFDELESRFKPRRIDVDIPYSEYYRPKSSRPQVSQRDPYLSPSKKPVDSFYPVPKTRSYSTPYRPSGRGSAVYDTGRYEDSQPYYGGGYTGSDYGSPSKYPPNDEPYNYQEDYTIESNKPIIGDIRKRLLDYAGASDLYEGEPDYLRQVAENKHKYGQIGNDYYAYGGPEYKKSYTEFPYVESKISLIKKSRLSRS